MSKIFQYPHGPLGPDATPVDFAKVAADVPYMGIYTTETTQRFVPGTRNITWDGRVFKYGMSDNTCWGGRLCFFGDDEVVSYAVPSATTAIGDTEIAFTAVAHTTVAKDELAGAYVVLYSATGDTLTQFRGIVGNDQSTTGTALTIYLDAPLSVATSSGVEIWSNPYLALAYAPTGSTGALTKSAAGVPATYVAVADYFFWVQTWGPCWVAPSVASFTTLTTGDSRDCFAKGDGSIAGRESHGSTVHNSQCIGFIMNEGLSSGPMIMLQLSI